MLPGVKNSFVLEPLELFPPHVTSSHDFISSHSAHLALRTSSLQCHSSLIRAFSVLALRLVKLKITRKSAQLLLLV